MGLWRSFLSLRSWSESVTNLQTAQRISAAATAKQMTPMLAVGPEPISVPPMRSIEPQTRRKTTVGKRISNLLRERNRQVWREDAGGLGRPSSEERRARESQRD